MRKEIRKTYNKLFGRLSKNKEIEIGEYEYVNQVGDVLKEMMKKYPWLYSYRKQYIGDFASVFKLDEGIVEFAMEETEILLHTMALNEISFESLNEDRNNPYVVTREDIVKYVNFLNHREFDQRDEGIIYDSNTLTLNDINNILNSTEEGATLEVQTYHSDAVHVDFYYKRD